MSRLAGTPDRLAETLVFTRNLKGPTVKESILSVLGLLPSVSVYFNCSAGFWVAFYPADDGPGSLRRREIRTERFPPGAME
ncbi:hypothetical protein ACSAZL_18795 [Methanosarcina sp. T3]|uniref:hypothetical protein n=1 Tax=Methanosarcina sp. T3 TaxID=3439062 RepID=UPI003F85DFF7